MMQELTSQLIQLQELLKSHPDPYKEMLVLNAIKEAEAAVSNYETEAEDWEHYDTCMESVNNAFETWQKNNNLIREFQNNDRIHKEGS